MTKYMQEFRAAVERCRGQAHGHYDGAVKAITTCRNTACDARTVELCVRVDGHQRDEGFVPPCPYCQTPLALLCVLTFLEQLPPADREAYEELARQVEARKRAEAPA